MIRDGLSVVDLSQLVLDSRITHTSRVIVKRPPAGRLAVYRPFTGEWYVRYSSFGYNILTAATFQWGMPGDIPVPSDFDGDGRTDLTIYRPSTGEWYVRYSSFGNNIAGAAVFQWGLPGDALVK